VIRRQDEGCQVRPLLPGPAADCGEQMALAHPARTVQQDRRHLPEPADGQFHRRVGHPVARPDDEILQPTQSLARRWCR
jgi:hypothetical protein